jgi:molecular chaperone GrpE
MNDERERVDQQRAEQEGSAVDPPAEAAEAAVEQDLAALLSTTERERDEYLELARRTQADFENYRKRMARESAEAESKGRAALVQRLLPVVDNLERALAAAQPMDREVAANHIAEGIRLVYEELNGVLRGAGVESYEPAGEQFDPEWHEAMLTRPAGEEASAGTIVEVLERGYRLNGQVLRPARVVVATEQGPPAGPPADGSTEG